MHSDDDHEVRGESSDEDNFEDRDAATPSTSAPTKNKAVRRKKKTPQVSVNLANCKYEVLRTVLNKLGWREVGDEDEWELYWTDTSIGLDRVMKLAKYQKINHFNGMLEICRKNRMGRNLLKMQKVFPVEYDFIPETYDLPSEMTDFLAQVAKKKKKTYILKPDAGCQGKGIRLVQTLDQANKAFRDYTEMGISNVVAQRYVMKPMLVHGLKFDLRIYVVVISVDPLRMFAFHEGLARFCTEKYEAPRSDNLDIGFMHLTNYAVNKKNDKFVFNADADKDDDGSKWSITALGEHLEQEGIDWRETWAGICDIAVKTVISIQPLLRSLYRSAVPLDNDGYSCFEILGMDVLIDGKGRPMLLECNHSPSFTTDTPLDLQIKEELIRETIQLARIDPELIRKRKNSEKKASERRLFNLGPGGKKKASEMSGAEIRELRARAVQRREEHEALHVDGKLHFERIYPSADPAKQAMFDRLLDGARQIYEGGSVLARAQASLSKLRNSAQAKKEALPSGSPLTPTSSSGQRGSSTEPATAAVAASSGNAAVGGVLQMQRRGSPQSLPTGSLRSSAPATRPPRALTSIARLSGPSARGADPLSAPSSARRSSPLAGRGSNGNASASDAYSYSSEDPSVRGAPDYSLSLEVIGEDSDSDEGGSGGDGDGLERNPLLVSENFRRDVGAGASSTATTTSAEARLLSALSKSMGLGRPAPSAASLPQASGRVSVPTVIPSTTTLLRPASQLASLAVAPPPSATSADAAAPERPISGMVRAPGSSTQSLPQFRDFSTAPRGLYAPGSRGSNPLPAATPNPAQAQIPGPGPGAGAVPTRSSSLIAVRPRLVELGIEVPVHMGGKPSSSTSGSQSAASFGSRGRTESFGGRKY